MPPNQAIYPNYYPDIILFLYTIQIYHLDILNVFYIFSFMKWKSSLFIELFHRLPPLLLFWASHKSSLYGTSSPGRSLITCKVDDQEATSKQPRFFQDPKHTFVIFLKLSTTLIQNIPLKSAAPQLCIDAECQNPRKLDFSLVSGFQCISGPAFSLAWSPKFLFGPIFGFFYFIITSVNDIWKRVK